MNHNLEDRKDTLDYLLSEGGYSLIDALIDAINVRNLDAIYYLESKGVDFTEINNTEKRISFYSIVHNNDVDTLKYLKGKGVMILKPCLNELKTSNKDHKIIYEYLYSLEVSYM